MSMENDTINNLGKTYDQPYADNNNTFFNDELSRSYSSGIDAPSVSSNLLRVYTRNNIHSQGSLRVRSSPSSPNRLSRLECIVPIHKNWPALAKVNITSSSELELANSQNSQTSNTSGDIVYADKLDLPKSHLVPISAPSSMSASWKNLQYNEDAKLSRINNELYPLCKSLNEKVTNMLVKQTAIIVEDENTENPRISSYHSEHTNYKFDRFQLSANKSPSNPINFKKVLRDRYLNSQRSSNTSTTSSSQNVNQVRPKSLFTSESLSSEPEDHNFNLIQESVLKSRQEQCDAYQKKLNFEVYRGRNSLSLDLINLTSPQKYRIRSNNSTVSSMSGIEPEGDPFSPVSIEICSPLLKLNLPYRNYNIKDSESTCRNIIPSSSLSALSSSAETDNFHTKSQESVSVRRFFPDTMKISDFNWTKSSKSDCHQHFPNHLELPKFTGNRLTSKSAPQSIQDILTCRQPMSDSLSPINIDATIPCISNQSSLSSPYSPGFETRGPKRISNSRSMDHINSYLSTEKKKDTSRSFDADLCDNSKQKYTVKNKSYPILKTTQAIRQKTKSISSVSISTKKTPNSSTGVNQRHCHVCGRHFNRSDMLARHIRVHTGHKPFECSTCGQSFSRSDHLNTHLRIHSGEKPYRCSICSYSACRRDMITRHLRVHKRKGDILLESNSSLVVNVNKQNIIQNKKNTKIKSQNSLNLEPDHYGDMRQSISSLYRSHSFTDTDQYTDVKEHNNYFSSVSPKDTPVITPHTFANISISISQPTPRSSFSISMETQNY